MHHQFTTSSLSSLRIPSNLSESALARGKGFLGVVPVWFILAVSRKAPIMSSISKSVVDGMVLPIACGGTSHRGCRVSFAFVSPRIQTGSLPGDRERITQVDPPTWQSTAPTSTSIFFFFEFAVRQQKLGFGCPIFSDGDKTDHGGTELSDRPDPCSSEPRLFSSPTFSLLLSSTAPVV